MQDFLLYFFVLHNCGIHKIPHDTKSTGLCCNVTNQLKLNCKILFYRRSMKEYKYEISIKNIQNKDKIQILHSRIRFLEA